MNTQLRTTLLLTLASGLAACGADQKRAKSLPGSSAIADELEAAARKGPAPGDAVITFGVFTGEPPPDDLRAASAAIRQRLSAPPDHLVPMLSGPIVPLTVSIVAIDDDLPLSVDALAAEAGEHARTLREARTGYFVRYEGDPMPENRQLVAAAASALLLAEEHGGVVVDLATRRTFSKEGWRDQLMGDTWLADQVVPEAVLDEDGEVMFYSMGMAKFGMPDLEMTDVDPAKARPAFGSFQEFLTQLTRHGYAKPGDMVDGVQLRQCRRPAAAIDHECVRM